MRTPLVLLALVPMLALAACDSSPPPAQTSKPAVTAPAAPAAARPATTPAATSLPAAARPLIGTWAEDLGTCGDAATVAITAATYTSSARSCAMNVKADGDGFALDCGGTAMTLVPVFAPSGEGVRVSVGGGKATTLLRCTK